MILNAQSHITVKILNSKWEQLVQFPATKKGSFTEDAEKVGFEIPTACGAWSCFFCAGHVKSGMEYIDIGKLGVPLVDLENDEILMCISGIKEECFLDSQPREVILEKDI